MGRRWIGALVVVCVLLVLAGCGGGGSDSGSGSRWSADDIAGCLTRAGAEARSVAPSDGFEMAEARAADGNFIFIVELPEPGLAETAAEVMRKKVAKEGLAGIMTSRTLDRGSILILVFGVKGVDGGAPSAASEGLARACATRPPVGGVGGQVAA